MVEAAICPFCGFKGESAYLIQLHIEEHHTDDSPFVVNETPYQTTLRAPTLPPRRGSASSGPSSRPVSDENPWVKCTRTGCGEYVAITDIQEHLNLHEAAALSEDEERESSGRNTPQDINGSHSLRRENGEQHINLDGYGSSTRRAESPSAKESISNHSRTQSSSHSQEAAPAARPRTPQKQPRSHSPPSLKSTQQKLKRPRPPSSNNSSHTSQLGILSYFAGTSHKGPPDRRDNRPGLPPRPAQRRPIRAPMHPGRLGRRELGPHAYEEAMPDSVRKRLLNDALPVVRNRIGWDGHMYRERSVDNETSGLVDAISDISAADSTVDVTYLCHRSAKHVEKIQCDGNFCGYWNIQMVLSYIHDQDAQRNRTEPKDLPSVLAIQNVIEEAWNNGICSYGRTETGGVRNTRKWIGTHEALAFFTQIGVEVEALSFKTEPAPSPSASSSDSSSQPSPTTHLAVLQLLDHVEAYFMSSLENAREHGTSYITNLPPIYFQRLGHSMTIVGIERKRDGGRNLLLLDPSYGTSGAMQRVLAKKSVKVGIDQLLRPYRRSELALSRWDEFEVIAPKTTKVQESQHKQG